MMRAPQLTPESKPMVAEMMTPTSGHYSIESLNEATKASNAQLNEYGESHES
jgi:hypothetical protein